MKQKRCAVIYCIFVVFFSILSIRLFYYAYGASSFSDNVKTANEQYSKRLNLGSRRGFLYDRQGRILAGLRDGYVTMVDPSRIPPANTDYMLQLANLSGLSPKEIMGKIVQHRPFTIRTTQELTTEYSYSVIRYKRYWDTFPAVHLLGYLDGSGHGVTGMERAYDEFLTKAGGETFFSYSSNGVNRILGGLSTQIYEDGYETQRDGLVLTLDLELQRKLDEIAPAQVEKGAVVIADSNTGEILAASSFPTYDPTNIAAYLDSPNGELLNRLTNSFTPGSLFKIVVACAALEYNPTLKEEPFLCDGSSCYAGIAHDEVDMTGAIAQSCNAYFMHIAQKIGFERIYRMAKKFGIGESVYFDSLSAGKGALLQPIAGERIAPMQLSNFAIGQGDTLMTPLEVTRMLCAVVQGGNLPALSLVKNYEKQGQKIAVLHEKNTPIMAKETADTVKQMLTAVITDGTGKKAKPATNGICGGKTASAQSGQKKDGKEVVHAWFAGFYKDTVITIFKEDGRAGGQEVAPLFAQLCETMEQLSIT